MIDEKKLLKHLYDWWLSETPSGDGTVLVINGELQKTPMMKTIEDFMKAVEEQPKVGEWIPCGKEKPRGGENIATVKWYDGTIEVVHAYYDGFDWITGCGERAEVIAWMPLPEPYKEGE